MTVALDSAPDSPEAGPGAAPDVAQDVPPVGQPAGWWTRAGAFAIDVLLGAGLVAAALMTGWSAPPRGWLWWLCMVIAAVTVVAIGANRLLLPANTGWSLGRAVFGIAVVDRDGDVVGTPRLALRDLAHLVDTVPLFLGWLWPLIDRRGRTFADILVGTEVREQMGPRPDRRTLAARLVAGVAALSVVVAALGYALVYRHQRAVDTAREQIALQGPTIVSDMLGYTAKTAADDFAKAQLLVTDEYRPELAKQQDAVRKNPVDNDYWVSNSSVLSAQSDSATMLMLLQGQRGAAPNQRFVTASVRVDFVRAGSQEWKLANLTVLSAPKPAPEPPKPEAPKSEAPKSEAPKPEAPKSEAPKSEAPKSEAPKSEAPKSEAPKPGSPKSAAPTPSPVAPKSDGGGR
ncbi:RDD family protein [Mycolicibacterium sp.]|uniref:RDD family protein n=1 Tax=Mycolicibacterium sp. TaxID=2320850 RepID=UPI0028A627E7|nr:RDD family protein [Mycolicibacterium sp.]